VTPSCGGAATDHRVCSDTAGPDDDGMAGDPHAFLYDDVASRHRHGDLRSAPDVVQSCVPVRTETLWPEKADVGVEGAKPHTLACNHDGRAGSAPE
jgi:hypothetical protein